MKLKFPEIDPGAVMVWTITLAICAVFLAIAYVVVRGALTS